MTPVFDTDAPEPDELTMPASYHQDVIRMWLRMLACTTLVETELRRQFRQKFDFTLPRFDVLAQLDRRPEGMVIGELSKRLMVSAGNVTPMIDRLITDGLVTRTPSEIDRRVQIVSITPEGRRRFRRMAKWNGQLLASIFGQVSPDHIAMLNGLLKEVKDTVVVAGFASATTDEAAPARKSGKADGESRGLLHGGA